MTARHHAQKAVNEYRIRRALGEPLTALEYQQLLDIANLGETMVGSIAKDVVSMLGECDQMPFLEAAVEREKMGEISFFEKKQEADLLNIVPNPSTGVCTFVFDHALKGTIMVLDNMGRRVYEQSVENAGTSISVDLGRLSNGLYRAIFWQDNANRFEGQNFVILH
jgi:hypothetical protein